jgi:hypothetical protein
MILRIYIRHQEPAFVSACGTGWNSVRVQVADIVVQGYPEADAEISEAWRQTALIGAGLQWSLFED